MFIKIVYNSLITPLIYISVSVIALFNKKLRKSINVRSTVISKLVEKRLNLNPYKTTVLFHCSSMGEYKQILPIVKNLTGNQDEEYNLVLSLFSPSAYENIDKEDSPFSIITYTPFDFYFVTKKFINTINPDIVLISKHDIWPNFIWELKKRDVPVYLINALFADDTKMDNWYAKYFYRSIFTNITGILTLNEKHRQRFLKIFPYPERIRVTGDTRFDAVIYESVSNTGITQLEKLNEIENVFIAGSSWPAGERNILKAWVKVKKKFGEAFLVIVPHEVGVDHIYKLESLCQEKEFKTIVFTEMTGKEKLNEYDVIIIDKVGLLSRIYKYGSIAYVGGGFSRNGIHSVLEPAAYGLPVVFGPHLDKSPEAQEMNNLNCGIIFNNENELYNVIDSLWSDKALYAKISELSLEFVNERSGATDKIIEIIKEKNNKPKFDKNTSLTEEEFEKLLGSDK
ncbi:MAG: hypothetical protein JXN63_00940 [Candidatus Delongbacteria bacterium]|nr:hypothetical protein [Candidatus Delongbacteria bacterium]